MSLISQIRILPVTIFAASLMLTIRLGDIWDDMDKLTEVVQVARATAQIKDQKTDTSKKNENSANKVADSDKQNEEAELENSSTKKVLAEPKSSSVGPVSKRIATIVSQDPTKLNKYDPTFLTPNEIELLQRLSERRDQLEKREQELNVREGLMQAAEVRIDNQIAELKKLEKMISSRLQSFDEQQLKKLENLVRIYESMKPKDAAKIFEDLEMDTLLEVAARMNSKKLAPVMAKMNPDKAREMTIELRVLGELPTFSGNLGGG